MPRRRLLFALPALLAVLAVVGLAAPAQAALVQIQLTQNGPQPAHRTIASGDRVQFVNTDSFPHSLKSSTPNWSFDITVNPGQASTPIRLTAAGTYGYRGTNFDTFTGDVRIPGGPSPAPTPSRSPSHSPSPSASATPAASASAGPRPTGSAASSAPTRAPSALAVGRPRPSAPARRTAAPRAASASPGQAVLATGPPPEPPTSRRYGLPAAVAAVALLGAASLLTRFLLAHAGGLRPA